MLFLSPLLTKNALAAHITAAPAQGAPGTSVTITGTAWPPGDLIKLLWNFSPFDTVARTPADANGAFTAMITVPQGAPASTNVLENSKIGYSLLYPDDWHVSGYVKWTEFANGSQCESVEVVDFQPPPGSGAGFILHSFVQICAKPLTDRSALDDFMRQTYGDTATQFQVADLAGMRAYRSVNAERDTTWFLQTNHYRIQIATAVVSKPDKQDMRLSQVQQILASLSFH
jgi:hypothetical protein